jgi:hypothetical protein
MSPKDQFSFDKKDVFGFGTTTVGTGATTTTSNGHIYTVKAPFESGTVSGSTYTTADGLTVVVTTAIAHGMTVGQFVTITLAGSGLNGTFAITAITTVSPFTFTYVVTTAGTIGSGTLTFSKNTGVIGLGTVVVSTPLLNRGADNYNGVNWTKAVTFGFRALRKVGSLADPNSEFRAFLGASYNISGISAGVPANSGEPVAGNHQVGYKQVGTGALIFMCSNGTAVSSVTTTFTPQKDFSYDVIFEVSGGIAKMFVNDVLVGTNTTAPSINLNIAENQLMALWLTAENKAPILAPNKEHYAMVCDYFLTSL